MGLEGHGDDRRVRDFGQGVGGTEDALVAEVHAVEVSDGEHRSAKVVVYGGYAPVNSHWSPEKERVRFKPMPSDD
ncbi:MAG: hypothetical protein AMXMBFR20_02500 [Planctomycetia bacterium]